MTDKISNWMAINVKWIITIIIIGISNYFILAGVVKDNTRKIYDIQRIQERTIIDISSLKDKNETTLSIMKNIKFNLKRQFLKQGITYIEDTDK